MNYLYFETKKDFDYFYNQNYVKNDTLRFESIENGIILTNSDSPNCPSGVFDNNGDYVNISTERYPASSHLSISSFENIETSDETVIYVGNFSSSHYGCFIIDYLNRFWYLISSSYTESPAKLVFIGNRNVFNNRWSSYFLSLFDINPEHILFLNNTTRFHRVIVPQLSFAHDVFINSFYTSIYQYLVNRIELSGGGNTLRLNSLYLTRTHLKKKKEIGERIFEKFFEMNDFSVIALETYSYAEQIALIRNCKMIASIEGTHAHSVVFRASSCKPYRQILLRKQSECIPRQIQINQVTNGEAVWIDVWKEPFNHFPISHDRGPFLIEWNNLIEQFAEDNHMVVPEINKFVILYNRVLYCWKCFCYAIKHLLKHVYVNYLAHLRLDS